MLSFRTILLRRCNNTSTRKGSSFSCCTHHNLMMTTSTAVSSNYKNYNNNSININNNNSNKRFLSSSSSNIAAFNTSVQGHQQQQQQQDNNDKYRRKPPSTTTIPNSSSSSSLSSLLLPVKHSSKQLPRTCLDSVQLKELTQEVLDTPIGSLFTYQPTSKEQQHYVDRIIIDDRDVAWKAADPTIQLMEYLIRGYSYHVPNTIWNRRYNDKMNKNSTGRSDVFDPSVCLEVCGLLMDRTLDEGYNYMTLRSIRLQELYGDGTNDDDDELTSSSSSNDDSDQDPDDDDDEEDDGKTNELDRIFQRYSIDRNNSKKNHIAKQQQQQKQQNNRFLQQQQEQQHQKNDNKNVPKNASTMDHDNTIPSSKYMLDFTIPGPTIAMYDTILDMMATSLHNMKKQTSSTTNSNDTKNTIQELCSPENTTDIFHYLLARHYFDMDCCQKAAIKKSTIYTSNSTTNMNVYTCPTILSYNATLRIAASQQQQLLDDASKNNNNNNNNNIKLRDETLDLAMSTFAELCSIDSYMNNNQLGIYRNTATYIYLLQTMDQCLPTSIIKGNITHGMFKHACEQGLINHALIELYYNIAQQQPVVNYTEEVENKSSSSIKTIQILSEYMNHYNDNDNNNNKNKNNTNNIIRKRWKQNSKKLRYHIVDDVCEDLY